MTRSRTLIRACFPVIAFAAHVTCSGAQADLADTSSPELSESDPVLAIVHRGDFTSLLYLTGELQATDAAYINAPRVHGQVAIRWLEQDGVSVRKGQRVIELDNAAFASDLEEKRLSASNAAMEIQQFEAQSRADAAEKKFAVEQRRIELEKAKLEAEIPRELLPLREFQEKQLALERAQTAYEKAIADHETHLGTQKEELEVKKLALQKTEYEIRLAEFAIESLSLQAPRDGVFLIENFRREDRKLDEGDTVWPGYRLASIPDLTEMHVVAMLSDVDDGRVRVGMPASVTVDSQLDRSFAATVLDVTPVARETSSRALRRAFEVRLALSEADPETMRPGMAARVRIETERRPDVLVVPRSAVDLTKGDPRVRVSGGEEVSVVLGPCNATECVVEDGLSEGHPLGKVAKQ